MSRNTDYLDGYYAEQARQVAKSLRRDNASKQRIFSRGLAFSVDAAEAAEMSARELAARELKSLGIEPGDNDPVALLDSHHAGRLYERNRGARGSASDSSEDSVVGRYLNAE